MAGAKDKPAERKDGTLGCSLAFSSSLEPSFSGLQMWTSVALQDRPVRVACTWEKGRGPFAIGEAVDLWVETV